MSEKFVEVKSILKNLMINVRVINSEEVNSLLNDATKSIVNTFEPKTEESPADSNAFLIEKLESLMNLFVNSPVPKSKKLTVLEHTAQDITKRYRDVLAIERIEGRKEGLNQAEEKIESLKRKLDEMKEFYFTNEEDLRARNKRLHDEIKEMQRGNFRATSKKERKQNSCRHFHVLKSESNAEMVIVPTVEFAPIEVNTGEETIVVAVPKCLECGTVFSIYK